MEEGYFFISVLATLIGFIIWVICLEVKKKKMEKKLNYMQNMSSEKASEFFDEYIIYCRNKAMKRRKEYIENIKKQRENGYKIQLWETQPEQAINEEITFEEHLSKCESTREYIAVYYRELPEVIYTFLCAQEENCGFSQFTNDEPRMFFFACLEKYHLDLESKKHAFDNEKV